MDDRCKKNIRLKNPTRYFNPTKTKTMVEIHSPNTYMSKRSKIEGYETRLYYEFKYCQEHNGQTYFYTLTYNDNNIPKYNGRNCFDYQDLRSLLNGAFTKYLLRHYGTKMKYFVGAELGDGKGTRGWHNNPHYHILFFLRSANDEKYPYTPISPEDFRSLVRIYWQGYDQGNNYTDFQNAKKGMVKEGDNLGLVQDFRAISYVAKYVCKDITLIQREPAIKRGLTIKYFNQYYNSNKSKIDFYTETLEKLQLPYCGYDDVISIVNHYIGKEGHLGQLYTNYINRKTKEKVQEELNEYRNRYCNKCRISQGVGEYALDFIENELDPSVPVATKNGIKTRTLNLYYYRKLYCNKVKDDKGNTMYVLNEKGINYKVAKLPEQLRKLRDRTWKNLQYIQTEEQFNNMYYSNINTKCWMKYDEYKNLINNRKDIKKIINRYAEYKLVYEDRFLKLEEDRFPSINVYSDYKSFITPIVDKVEPNRFSLTTFLEDTGEGYLAYYSHPYFLRYYRYFDLFDTISDYSFIKEDNQKEQEAKEAAEIRRFHLGRQFQY